MFLVLGLGQIAYQAHASALPGNRAVKHGYFTNYLNSGSGDFVIPGGTFANPSMPYSVNTIAEFKAYVLGEYKSTTTWNHIGGAFIIRSMMGPDASGNWNYNSSISNADITAWQQQIDYLISSGGSFNPDATFAYCYNSYNIHNHGVDSNPDDVAFYSDCDSEAHTFVFYHKNGSVAYAIKHRCANPVGDYLGLPRVPKWTLAPKSVVDKTTASPGQVVKFTHTIDRHLGPDTATSVDYTAYYFRYKADGTLILSNRGAGGIDVKNATIPKSSTALSAGVDSYTAQSSDGPGSKLCEMLRIDGFESPPSGTTISDSAKVCVTFGAPGKPVVSIACDSAYKITGNAKDPDKAIALALSFTRDGTAIAAGPLQTDAAGNFSFSAASLMTDGSNHVFGVVAKGVNAAGTADGNNGSATATCSPAAIPSNCPRAPTTQKVTLTPKNIPVSTNEPSSTGYAPQASQTYNVYSANGKYKIDSVYDEFESVGAGTGTWTPTGKSVNDFTINYSSYIDNYPYDSHRPNVNYDSYYDSLAYRSAASPTYGCDSGDPAPVGTTCKHTYSSTYNCPSGGTLSGTTCTSTYAAPSGCAAGETLSGSTCSSSYNASTNKCAGFSGFTDTGTECTHTYPGPAPCTRTSDYSTAGPGTLCTLHKYYVYTCPSGGTLSGTKCVSSHSSGPYCNGADTLSGTTCTHTYTATAGCNSGDTVSGSTCTHTYAASNLGYLITRYAAGDVIDAGFANSSGSDFAAPTLPECFDRSFNLVPISSSASLDDSENPTSVNFIANVNPGLLSATDHGTGVRRSLKVSVPIKGVYYTKDINGNVITGVTDFDFNINPIYVADSALARSYSGFSIVDSASVSSASTSRPPLNYGDQICFRVQLPNAAGTMDENGLVQNTDSSTESIEICSDRVGNKPYYKVYGSDIFAGGSFASAGVCTSGVNASIIGQYNPSKGGASTDLAAIALARVSNVASAALRSVSPTAPNGLTFANSGSDVNPNPPTLMGGFYSDGTGHCAPDYYNDERFGSSSTNLTNSTSTDVDVSSGLANGGQTVIKPPVGARVQIHASTGKTGIRHTLFIDGDAQITSNIVYNDGPWADTNSIPYLTIIAKGNIYIDESVSDLNGLFIAQPRTSPTDGTGRIYTCTYWKLTNGNASDLKDRCDNQLRVTGSFVAQRILLERTTGTINLASDNGGTAEASNSPNIAEIFQSSAEQFIGHPVFKSNPLQYDSIKGLPPVLQ